MFKATPKNAAAIIRGKSWFSIFSLGPKTETNQNRITEPPTRIVINPNGRTNFGITSLAIVKVTP